MAALRKIALHGLAEVLITCVLMHLRCCTGQIVTAPPQNFTIPEGELNGTYIGTISLPAGETIVQIVENHQSGASSSIQNDLRVDPVSGHITTKVQLDRERRDLYNFAIMSSDMAIVHVIVNVLDINDNSPVFKNSSITISLPESTPTDAKVALGSAVDLDMGINSTQRYAIVSGNDDHVFKLSTKRTGLILLLDLEINGTLDYEREKFYFLKIHAYDGGIPRRTGEMNLTIVIVDMNDNQPIFNQSKYSAAILENATMGHSVLEVQATDQDSGENGKVRYSLDHSHNSEEHFSIDPVTGVLRVSKPLDYETKAKYDLIVLAQDNGTQSVQTSASIEVIILNINELPANIDLVFLTSGNQSARIPENANIGSNIARISVNDPDNPGQFHSNVSVTLHGGDGFFNLTSNNNVVYLVIVKKPLDREQKPHYNLTVLAVDSGTPPLHASRSFTLWIDDINDNAPIFTKSIYRAEIDEMVHEGTAVVQVKANDPDEGENARITYKILNTPNTHSDWFQVDNFGHITTQGTIDCETDSEPRLTVVATDSGTSPLSSSAEVIIRVRDQNDNQPQFSPSYYQASVDENRPPGSCVLQVSATDPDAISSCGGDLQITYGISNTTSHPPFTIHANGSICIAQTLDYETQHSYEFPVSAADSRFISTAMVTIRINDVNDNYPEFYPRNYSINVDKNAPINKEVVTVSASDLDSGEFGKVYYSIEYGNDIGYFAINSESGVISLVQRFARAEEVHRLRIRARDGGGKISTTLGEVYVSVTGADDHPPVFATSTYRFSVSENATPDTYIGTVHASVDSSSLSIRYSIWGGDRNSFFKINDTSGQIFVNHNLDHDEFPSVLLNIQAATGNPPTFGQAQVNITVTDINDNFPIFTSTNVEIQVREDTEVMTTIYVAHAEDKDSGAFGSVRYHLKDNPQGLFNIDTVSGELRLAQALDYEDSHQFHLVVKASDNAPADQSKTSSMMLTVNVDDINDNPPKFAQSSYEISVSENIEMDTQFTQVVANDLDSGNNGRVTYSLEQSVQSEKFGIYQNSGSLYVREGLDRELQSQYELRVIARDNGATPLSDTADVTIIVGDANDNNPEFTESEYIFFVVENQSIGTEVGRVSATDQDSGDNGKLQYTFSKSTNKFVVNLFNGEITTKGELDRESKPDYELTVLVTDKGATPRKGMTRVRINVLDENDNSPVFQPSVLNAIKTVDENRQKGTKVYQMIATDADNGENGTVSYFLGQAGGDSAGTDHFAIHVNTGWITTKEVLDFETRNRYSLQVIAKDGSSPPREKRETITILVNDANDETPIFPSLSLTFSVLENVPVGTVVDRVVAEDRDSGENGRVSYFLISGNVFGMFAINSSTGDVYSIREIDYEESSSHTLGIKAIDNSVYNPKSSTISVIINIIDLNDNAPVFDHDPVVLRVKENLAVNHHVYTFSASDRDSGLNGTVRYTISNQSADPSYFKINPTTGLLQISHMIDYEMVKEISLNVHAHDMAEIVFNRLNTTITVIIFILDENDNAPVFQTDTKVAVFEDEPVGFPVKIIIATDEDSNINNSKNNVISYHILAGNENNNLNLEPDKGILTIGHQLDREAIDQYVLNISATDQGNPRLASFMLLTIDVLDVNDNPPVFEPSVYTAHVEENRPPGASVTTIRATDQDIGINGNLTYLIPSGIAQDKFAVDATTGLVTTTQELDREGRSSYVVTAYVRDGGYPVKYNVATIIVNITDVNDNAPLFKDSTYFVEIPENMAQHGVHTFLAFDADSGENGKITYSITDGDPLQNFSINSATGQLSCSALDRETRSKFHLTIRARDGGSLPKSGYCNVTITILDQNDNDPKFIKEKYSASFPEDIAMGEVVLQVSARDPDEGINGEVTYSLGNDTDGLFRVDSETGIITTTGTFDREKKTSYVFDVVAKDGGLYDVRTEKVHVEINIEDVNDNAPVFTQVPFTQTIPDNTGVNQHVLTVSAVDKDEGLNASIRYVRLEDNNVASQYFRIDDTTGSIITKQSQQPVGHYSLRVVAADQGTPSLSSTGAVEITVGSAAGTGHIQFDNTNYSAIVVEHSPPSTSVIQVRATVTNGMAITYGFANGNEDNTFTIDVNNGWIQVNNKDHLDYETSQKIRLVVVASASGASPGYATVWVNLEDTNDNPPKFLQEVYISAVWEEQVPGTYVTQVQASDDDEGLNGVIEYSIVSGDEDNAFIIYSPRTGIVTTALRLDREVQDGDKYRLVIEAKDQGNPALSSSCTLRITVVDENDNPPYFPATKPANISESSGVGTLVAMVTANDVDLNPVLHYDFGREGNPDNMFSIDPFSGRITLAKVLDHEHRTHYLVALKVNDSKHEALTTLEVNVVDENDNPPEFSQQSYEVMLEESSTGSQFPVVTVNATDKDSGENARITYKLQTLDNRFGIDPQTGTIFSIQVITYNSQISQQTIQLIVKAEDGGNPPLSDAVGVHITVRSQNKFAPVFKSQNYTTRISEDAKRGSFILQVTAEDQDKAGRNQVIDYRIIGGNDGDAFGINRGTGRVFLNSELDRENMASYTLTVKAKDRGIPAKMSNVAVYIEVGDVNDMPPHFDQDEYFISLKEDFPSDTTFLTVNASDDDEGLNSKIQYTITSGNSDGLFIVNGLTGAVVITPNANLDYEHQTVHKLIVRATDCLGCSLQIPRLTAFATITVNVTDVNDHYPLFPVPFYIVSVPENRPIGTYVYTIHANDKDGGHFGQVEYQLINTRDFRIYSNNGSLFTLSVFDREGSNRFQFIATATDTGGLNSSVTVLVTIQDVDEYRPMFMQNRYSFSIPGSAKPGLVIGSVNATDKDAGEAGRIVYRFKQESDYVASDYFEINPSSGVITVKVDFNAEIPSRRKRDIHNVLGRRKRALTTSSATLIVEASSGLEGSLSDNAVVEVLIDRTCPGCEPVTYTGTELKGISLVLVIVFAIVAVVLLVVIVVILLRRRYKRQKPTGDIQVFDHAFDHIDIPRNGGPPAYSDIINRFGSHSEHATTSEVSDHSHISASSGRGSAEEDEDEEIRMINSNTCLNQSGGLLRKAMPDSGIQDDDNTSEPSIPTHQEYLARLGIDSTRIPVKNKPVIGRSVESMHQFSDEGGGEGIDIGTIDYDKLGEVETDDEVARIDNQKDQGFHEAEPQHNGSLSSVINSEEEYSGSYNWDYLLDWGPQYQPLAHVFTEIARLKDDTIQPKKQPIQTVPQRRINTTLNPQIKTVPPPMITNAPPKALVAPTTARSSHTNSSGSSQANSTRNSTMNTSLPSLPRSPISHESSFTSPALTPSFTPSLSPLATRSPSISPVVSGRGMGSSSHSSGHNTPNKRSVANGHRIGFTVSSGSEQELRI